MSRSDIINLLIRHFSYNNYLEIGVEKGINFKKIKIKNKIGVDPCNRSFCTHKMTSDSFFLSNRIMFDIIFIDGLHHADQFRRDISNSLTFLNPNGTIVCHDLNPTNELMQHVPRETKTWTGDCWKAWVTMRMERDDLEMFVLDTDYGVGIIRRGVQLKLVNRIPLDFHSFLDHREEWLNLKNPEYITKWIKKQGTDD